MFRTSPDKMDYPRIPRQLSPGIKRPARNVRPLFPTEGAKRTMHKRLLKIYGIGIDRYEALFIAQGGCCAICRQVPSGWKALHVDHNHATGKVRGLLCTHCNRGIGGFRDNPSWCRTAVNYLLDNDVLSDAHFPGHIRTNRDE